MTNTNKNWKLLEGWNKEKPKANLPLWLFDVLANRGIVSEQEIYSFLEAEYTNLIDPFEFTNMKEAVERIAVAKEKNEVIFVYGDYDVDGICATAIIFEALNKIGMQNVKTYIPHREEEGYGLNEAALKEIEEAGASLVVTVDCGITSRELIDSSKMDFIVCDHHEIAAEKIPQKAIVLHPNLVAKLDSEKPLSLCGAGMAFFFVKGLQKKFPEELQEGQEKWLLDLAALATICDVVPLIGQNRILAKWGLLVLSKTKRVGLLELMKIAALKPEEASSYAAGFILGPRLNAAGRLEHAKKSLELVLTENKTEAKETALELNNLNLERQQICEEIVTEAKARVESEKPNNIILLSDSKWPRGVVGIIASRIAEAYGKPAIVFENDGEHLHGSARSVGDFDITEALTAVSEHLVKFGGHSKAAGLTLTVQNFEKFKKAISLVAEEKIPKDSQIKTLEIDAKLKPEDINDETMELLTQLEPFGFGNKTPIFILEKAEIGNIKKVGQNNEHLKFSIQKPATRDQRLEISGIWFNANPEVMNVLNSQTLVDLVFNLKYNFWNERKSIEMRIIDMNVSVAVEVTNA